MFTEERAALARFHQFNKTQLDWPRLDPRKEGVQLMMVYIAHQHGVDFHFFKTRIKGGVNACHHLLKLVLPGNGMKLTGIQAVDADVERGQSGIAPGSSIARQTITIGSYRNLTDGVVFAHGGDNVSKVATQ